MLNTAQQLIFMFCEGGNLFRDYKAPHANRPTPPRKLSKYKERRLFKGWRA